MTVINKSNFETKFQLSFSVLLIVSRAHNPNIWATLQRPKEKKKKYGILLNNLGSVFYYLFEAAQCAPWGGLFNVLVSIFACKKKQTKQQR